MNDCLRRTENMRLDEKKEVCQDIHTQQDRRPFVMFCSVNLESSTSWPDFRMHWLENLKISLSDHPSLYINLMHDFSHSPWA